MSFDTRDDTWAKVSALCRARVGELMNELASNGYSHSEAVDAARRGGIEAFREILALAETEETPT